jgi:hypothetical protein
VRSRHSCGVAIRAESPFVRSRIPTNRNPNICNPNICNQNIRNPNIRSSFISRRCEVLRSHGIARVVVEMRCHHWPSPAVAVLLNSVPVARLRHHFLTQYTAVGFSQAAERSQHSVSGVSPRSRLCGIYFRTIPGAAKDATKSSRSPRPEGTRPLAGGSCCAETQAAEKSWKRL